MQRTGRGRDQASSVSPRGVGGQSALESAVGTRGGFTQKQMKFKLLGLSLAQGSVGAGSSRSRGVARL